MKQMIKDVVEIYNEDKKEFITGILGVVIGYWSHK